ncbi:MAG: hypothetical protein IBX57_00065 [Gammaproteobacteria bacterium]|nr:hypothetical protein [Gammaproteobacteria bacterium]
MLKSVVEINEEVEVSVGLKVTFPSTLVGVMAYADLLAGIINYNAQSEQAIDINVTSTNSGYVLEVLNPEVGNNRHWIKDWVKDLDI